MKKDKTHTRSKNLNVHLYTSNFKHESRILKETQALADHQITHKILMIGISDNKLPSWEKLDAQRSIYRVVLRFNIGKGFLKKIFNLIEWHLRVFFFLVFKPVDMINCHSLTVLPLGCLLKLFKRCPLIYDTHELETETVTLTKFRKKPSKIIEKWLIKYADLIFVVSPSIEAWYRKTYQLDNIYTIRNIPNFTHSKIPAKKPTPFKQKFNIPENHIVFLYQGSLGYGRGVDLLLTCFQNAPLDKHIVFMGFGELEEEIKEFAKQHQNIHFHPAVKSDELYWHTQNADVGIHLIENSCLNHYYCLPNKIFEYMLSGLPVIVSDLADMSALIKQYQSGIAIKRDKETVEKLISNISLEQLNIFKQNLIGLEKKLNWKNEEALMIQAYHAKNITN